MRDVIFSSEQTGHAKHHSDVELWGLEFDHPTIQHVPNLRVLLLQEEEQRYR